MTNNPTPKQIAAKLTDAQREWVKAMPTIPTSMSPEQWDGVPRIYVEMDGREYFFAAGCAHKPVGTDWYFSFRLNDLGLAVRAILTENDHDR